MASTTIRSAIVQGRISAIGALLLEAIRSGIEARAGAIGGVSTRDGGTA